ncbi:vacuolar protein sorting-associated protein 33A-like [Drosophila sulfurigaster albostrigata]|uniref:vacuolar protein sorting-associated protein 33A-like n=1 Tax=Drosophila sulfurigaster albostrigata TaxID=89887 RepID=UPI002D21B03F|nr:vacuolar protein sorting-associated protein 33A-like [Drosophila sulfurigaster albostrigata]
MFPHLKSDRVNLQLLQESACRELVQQLDAIHGSKVIVLDEAMIGPLGLVTKLNLFTERSIDLLPLKPEMRFPKKLSNIVYIVRPQVALMDQLVAHVKTNSQHGRQFHILFMPRRSCLCIKHLENKEVMGAFGRLEELPWNFLPLDADVVSMEMLHAYRDVSIDGDTTALYQAAIGLVQLQRLYGRIPKIYGKGVQAQLVWDHAKQLAIDEKSLYNGDKGAIDQLILLDRGIDLLSPLATQLTYEGLIDEFYGIRQNQLTLPAEHFPSYNAVNSSSTAATAVRAAEESERLLSDRGQRKTLMLHSGEELYAELRNKNFNEVRMLLVRKVKEIREQLNSNSQQQKINLSSFYDRLEQLTEQKRAPSDHTAIAGLIDEQLKSYAFNDDLAAEQEFMVCADIDKPSSYIEDLIARHSELHNVLRLICLQCAAASGFKERVLNHYKRELAHVYGLEVLLTISNLEKAGLLHAQTKLRAYAVLRKTLHLTVDDSVEVNPKDISYVHSFYAPLTARLVEHSLKPLGWQSLKSQINNLPGPTFEDFQVPLIGIGGRHGGGGTPSETSLLHARRVVLVLFVGGCTFAEIAALRFLAAQEDNNVQFLIATTKIINKRTFLESVMGS